MAATHSDSRKLCCSNQVCSRLSAYTAKRSVALIFSRLAVSKRNYDTQAREHPSGVSLFKRPIAAFNSRLTMKCNHKKKRLRRRFTHNVRTVRD